MVSVRSEKPTRAPPPSLKKKLPQSWRDLAKCTHQCNKTQRNNSTQALLTNNFFLLSKALVYYCFLVFLSAFNNNKNFKALVHYCFLAFHHTGEYVSLDLFCLSTSPAVVHSFPKVAFKTVIWLTMALPRPFKEDHPGLPLSVLFLTSNRWCKHTDKWQYYSFHTHLANKAWTSKECSEPSCWILNRLARSSRFSWASCTVTRAFKLKGQGHSKVKGNQRSRAIRGQRQSKPCKIMSLCLAAYSNIFKSNLLQSIWQLPSACLEKCMFSSCWIFKYEKF